MRLGCQVVDSNDLARYARLESVVRAPWRDGTEIRALSATSRVSVYGAIHLKTQWFMRNFPRWKMSDEIRYNAPPSLLSIQ